MGWVWYGLGLVWVGFGMGWVLVWAGFGIGLVWYWFGIVWYGIIWNSLVCSIMSNASLCFILDEGLETFLEIRDLCRNLYPIDLHGYKATKLPHL